MFTKLRKSILKAAAGVLALCIVLAISLVCYLVISHNQLVSLPSPSGAYQVGRTELDWVDSSRPDSLADAPGKSRELSVWIWYPAQVTASSLPAPFLPPAWAKAKAADDGLGAYLERDSARIHTHSFLDAPISSGQGTFPIVVFQPGFGPAIYDYTVFAEDLASHGYVVVGINETESQFFVSFPDGRVIARSNKGNIPDNADPATADQDANRIGQVWTQDAIFVMNQLELTNQDASSPFFQKLEVAHIGLLGHSFGGAVAMAVCQSDARCQAGANLDGTPLSDTANQPTRQPFLFVSEGYSQPFPQGCLSDKNCQPLYAAYQQMSDQAYFVTVNGAKHFNFTDRSLRSLPLTRVLLKQMGIVGSMDPARGLEITSAYLAAFFDHYLKGENSPLFAGASSAYPEVQLESRKP